MKRFDHYSLLVLFLFSLVSCNTVRNTSLPDKEATFQQFLLYENVNEDIELSMPEGLNPELKLCHSVGLMLKNNSSDVISFPPDYGIKIFVYNNAQWREVRNNTEYFPVTNDPETNRNTLHPKGPDHFGFHIIGFNPLPENCDAPIEFRVLVEGMILKDDQPTDEKADAYMILHFLLNAWPADGDVKSESDFLARYGVTFDQAWQNQPNIFIPKGSMVTFELNV